MIHIDVSSGEDVGSRGRTRDGLNMLKLKDLSGVATLGDLGNMDKLDLRELESRRRRIHSWLLVLVLQLCTTKSK
jgi:hypothetical protein